MSNSVAILIDADNISATYCGEILNGCVQHGTICVKRAYGDFTQGNAKSWIACLQKHNIDPQLNLAVGTGKNAADIALVIDAMEMLHANNIDTFCIVSSDSDFTPVATRLREQGKHVIGFGETKTTNSFRNACEQFTVLTKPEPKSPAKQQKPETNLTGFDIILSALKDLQVNKDWITLSPLGKNIKTRFPEIKYSELGGRSLKQVVLKMDEMKLLKTTNTDKGFSVRIR